MRKPRHCQAGATYHAIARANRSEFILQTDTVKELFLQTMVRAKQHYRFEVISLCIMSNHFHLMIKPGKDESISRVMQWILSVFAIHYNKMFSLHGHVWYDRFKSKVINSLRQFVATFNYIANNPVVAGLADEPAQYRYGPYRLARDGPLGSPIPPIITILRKVTRTDGTLSRLGSE